MRTSSTTTQNKNSKTNLPETSILVSMLTKLVADVNRSSTLEKALSTFCDSFVLTFSEICTLCLTITFDGFEYKSSGFFDASVSSQRTFHTPDNKKGRLKIYLKETENNSLIIQQINESLDWVLPFLIGTLSKFQLAKLVASNAEREKELKSINLTAEILESSTSLDQSFQDICLALPQAMQYPKYTVARILYDGKSFVSKNFKESSWALIQKFETSEKGNGSIEIYYTKQFPLADDGPFLHEERRLINNLAKLIAGTVSKNILQDLLVRNTERLKELKGINSTSEILRKNVAIEDALREICNILPDSFQYVNETVVRISYEDWVFQSASFRESPWSILQEFETIKKKKGTIEIFYLNEFPPANEGPFLKEERDLLINIANLISGSASKVNFARLQSENTERLKELKAINRTSKIIEEGNSVEETLAEICSILPKSWQYPKYTAAQIKFEGKSYCTNNFRETVWSQKENFITIDNKKGSIEIYYLKQFPKEKEGAFLQEERNLLVNIGKLISGYLNNYKGREIYNKNVFDPQQTHMSDEFRKSLIKNKKPLQLYFNQQSIDKYVYLDMMKYKIKHILFVATLYDAFVLENEDSFFEKFMGEIYQYSLFSVPRITGVSSPEEALELLETTHFDLVILMVGIDCKAPIDLSEKIKAKNETLPIYLLLNKKSDVKYFEELVPTIRSVEKIFVWNGDSVILFSIVKSIEDKINVENDTKIGLVRVILLIEDSPIYYSKYLQILYSIVFGQVQQLLPEVEKNELDKIGKIRSRPKVLLARNYDEALIIFNKYKDFLLCIISDVEFERAGKMDRKAGIKFIKYVQSHIFDLPVILQSASKSNEKIAQDLNVKYINKNSETLLNDLKKYLTRYMGFGNFTFRDKSGNKVGVAKSLRDFENLIQVVPDESFYVHASENQFSLWLMARGEIELAKTLNPIALSQFSDLSESRKFFRQTFKKYKEEKKKGKILRFDETSTLDEKNIVSFSGGSLGGKGRGLAFISTLINNLDFSSLSDQINIISPITVIIGTDEFQKFISRNKLLDKIVDASISFQALKKLFVEASLSHSLLVKLKDFVNQIDKPFAVRSSSTSEDSLTQPFAGVFDTYIVPNCQHNKKIAYQRICTAIKLVFASVYSPKARTYFKAIHHKIEEEKMAIVLQELVGTQHQNYYYPHISGVAQSYNYYPVAHMLPEEGFAVAAVGLGSYVVDGWKSYRFSPVYPKLSMFSVKDLLKSTQVQFYALDCSIENVDFLKDGELAALKLLDIDVAEEDSALQHCVSVYNPDNDRVDPGLSQYGPRIINFADILQYNYIPLSETISVLLNTIKEAFGSPVEIEYAVNLDRTKNNLPSFYLLQIKPLVGNQLLQNINLDNLDQSKMILSTKSSLGNGQINHIRDIIFVDKDKFNKLKTIEMAKEIEYLNGLMVNADRQYVLIGPGRWGTRDQYIGIPVVWSQISNAKVIVEMSLDNFPLDSSLGSHFFHNVTSMNIGYFSIQQSKAEDFIRWDVLNKQRLVKETNYFKHIRFEKPVTIFMDGIHRKSAIITEFEND